MSLFDTPFSVTVIPQEVLIDQQVRSLGDIVRNDPSAVVSTPPGFNDTVNIRGYNLNNSSSYRREGLIFQNQVQNPFENKAAVEIIKGPTSVRYGFTPPGGVVNYVLKRPTGRAYEFAQVFGDSNGSYGVHADLGGLLAEGLGFRLNAVVSNEAPFVDSVEGPRYLASGAFEWRPIPGLRIDIEAEYQYRELEQQATIRLNSFADEVTPEQRAAILGRFDQTTFLGQSWGSYPTSNFIGSVGVEYDIAQDWKIYGRVQAMRLVRDQQAAGIAAGSLQANGDFQSQIFFDPSQVRDPVSAEAFLTGRFSTFGITHDIAIGGAISSNPLRFSLTDSVFDAGPSNIFEPQALPPPNAVAGPTRDALFFDQRAVFASDLISIFDYVKVFAAVRWSEQENRDRFNESETLETTYQDSAVVPNLGLIINPLDWLTVYGSFSQGITTGVQIPNDAANFGADVFLDPAETEQFEVGVKLSLLDGVVATAAYFDISQPLATFDEENVFGYIGNQVHRGAEVSLSGELLEGLRVIAGGLFLSPEISNPSRPDVDGNRPSGVTDLQVNLFADYQLPFLDGLALNAGLFYTGSRFADEQNTFEIDAYARLDVGARYALEVADRRFTARLNVRNVADNDFIEGTAFGSFFFGAPATAVFSLSAEL